MNINPIFNFDFAVLGWILIILGLILIIYGLMED